MIVGDIVHPYTLAAALQSTLIKPGHTLYLRGGTYTGAFVSGLVGVTIMPYQDEKPIIDGSFTINGSDSTYEDLEIMQSGWNSRISAETGSNPSDMPSAGAQGSGVDVNGPRTIVRRCTVHDTRQGFGLWNGAVGAVLEECLTYNNGWDAPDRGHGHDCYTQNQQPTKTIRNCAFLGGYSDYALHAYTQGSYVQNYLVDGMISMNRQNIFQGGGRGIDGIDVRNSVMLGGSLAFATGGTANGAVSARDTDALNGATISRFGGYTSYAEQGTRTALGDRILTRRRFVVVCNQSRAASVPAPKVGRYTNAQNPAESITLEASDPLPMSGWTVATPYAAVAPLATFDPRFAVFLVTS